MPFIAMSAYPTTVERVKALNSYSLSDDAADQAAALEALWGGEHPGIPTTAAQQSAIAKAGWFNAPQQQPSGGGTATDFANVVSAFGTAVPAIMTAARNQPVNIKIPAIRPVAQQPSLFSDWKIWAAAGIGIVALGAGVFVLTKKR